jgi:hypothetical protein
MRRRAPTASNSACNCSVNSRTVWLVTIPRLVLGAIFAGAALNYFWSVAFGRMLVPVSVTSEAMQFAGMIIKTGYLWPLMKAINFTAGILLITNRAPAFAVALLLPVTVIIVWFQLFLNPLPVPMATAAVEVLCEMLLLRAYASRYADMFMNDRLSTQESTR